MSTQRFLLVCCVLGPVLFGASAWCKRSWIPDPKMTVLSPSMSCPVEESQTMGVQEGTEKCDRSMSLTGVWSYIQCHVLRFLRATAIQDAIYLVCLHTKSPLCEISFLRCDHTCESHFDEPEPKIPPEVDQDVPVQMKTRPSRKLIDSSMKIYWTQVADKFGERLKSTWENLYSGMRQNQMNVILSLSGWVVIACVWMFMPTFHRIYLRPFNRKNGEEKFESSGICTDSESDLNISVLFTDLESFKEVEIDGDLDQAVISPSTGSRYIPACTSGDGLTSFGFPSAPTTSRNIHTGCLCLDETQNASSEIEGIPLCGSSANGMFTGPTIPTAGSERIPVCGSCADEMSGCSSLPSIGSCSVSAGNENEAEIPDVASPQITRSDDGWAQLSFPGCDGMPSCINSGTAEMFVESAALLTGSESIKACANEICFFSSSSSTGSCTVPACNAIEADISADDIADPFARSGGIQAGISDSDLSAISCPSYEVLQNEDTVSVSSNQQHDVSEYMEILADVHPGQESPFAWTFRIRDHVDEPVTFVDEPSSFSSLQLPSQPSHEAISTIQGFYSDSAEVNACSDGVHDDIGPHTQSGSYFTETHTKNFSADLSLESQSHSVSGLPPWALEQPANIRLLDFSFDDVLVWGLPDRHRNEPRYFNGTSTLLSCSSFLGSNNDPFSPETVNGNTMTQFGPLNDWPSQNRSTKTFPINQNSERYTNGTEDWMGNAGGQPPSHPASPDNVAPNNPQHNLQHTQLTLDPHQTPGYCGTPNDPLHGFAGDRLEDLWKAHLRQQQQQQLQQRHQAPIIPLKDVSSYFGALSYDNHEDNDSSQPVIRSEETESYFGPFPDLYPSSVFLDAPARTWTDDQRSQFNYRLHTIGAEMVDFSDSLFQQQSYTDPFTDDADGTTSNATQHQTSPNTEPKYADSFPSSRHSDCAGANSEHQPETRKASASATKAERKQRVVEIPMNIEYIYESCDNGKLVPVKDFLRIMEMTRLGVEERKEIVSKQFVIAREKCCLDWIESIRNRGKKILPKWWLQKYMQSDGLESNKCRKRREWLERKQAEALEAERLKELEELEAISNASGHIPPLVEPTGPERLLFQYGADGRPLFDIQDYFANYIVENEGLFPVPSDNNGQPVADSVGDGVSIRTVFGNTGPAVESANNFSLFSDTHTSKYCARRDPRQAESARESDGLYASDMKDCRQSEIEKEDGRGDSLHEI